MKPCPICGGSACIPAIDFTTVYLFEVCWRCNGAGWVFSPPPPAPEKAELEAILREIDRLEDRYCELLGQLSERNRR